MGYLMVGLLLLASLFRYLVHLPEIIHGNMHLFLSFEKGLMAVVLHY